MTPTSTMRQVRLQKNGRERIAWIPDSWARRGTYIRLHDDDGWKVTDVYARMDAAFVQARSRDYRTQRTVSDV